MKIYITLNCSIRRTQHYLHFDIGLVVEYFLQKKSTQIIVWYVRRLTKEHLLDTYPIILFFVSDDNDDNDDDDDDDDDDDENSEKIALMWQKIKKREESSIIQFIRVSLLTNRRCI